MKEKKEDYTLINSIRVILITIALIITYRIDLESNLLLISTVIPFVFSISWLLMEYFNIVDNNKNPHLGYIAISFDIYTFTIYVILTGGANSSIVAGYIYAIAVCSLNTKIKQGLYSVILSILSYSIIVILITLNIIPSINIFGGGATNSWYYTTFSILLTSIGFVAVYLTVNSLIIRERNLLSKNENLLLSIFPEKVADDLISHGESKPVFIDCASIMFIDFVSFSIKTRNVSPEDLITVLDYYYKNFDLIIKKHNVEKIKTIGDGYMCVSGLPIQNSNHANNICYAAYSILQFVKNENHNRNITNQLYFDIRIGINSGELFAGIIGNDKYSYDIWGDAVNIASRLESQCPINSINISKSTYELVEKNIQCKYRGKLEAKNIGLIDMYLIEEVTAPG
jgi:class 3 adenylate cyclase